MSTSDSTYKCYVKYVNKQTKHQRAENKKEKGWANVSSPQMKKANVQETNAHCVNKRPLCAPRSCIKNREMVTRDGRLGTSSAAMLNFITPIKTTHCHLALESCKATQLLCRVHTNGVSFGLQQNRSESSRAEF